MARLVRTKRPTAHATRRREAAAVKVERKALKAGLILIHAHAPRVEILVLLDQAVIDADAVRAGDVNVSASGGGSS